MASAGTGSIRWSSAGVLLALSVACQQASPAATDTGAGSTSSSGSPGSNGSSSSSSSGSSTGTGGGISTGGTSSGGVEILSCDAGLPGLSLTAAEHDEIAESCVIDGTLLLGGSASLTVVPGVVLTVIGDVSLTGTSTLAIDGGVLGIGNLSSFEHGITVTDDATFSLANSQLVTNPTGTDNFTSTLSASGRARVVFDGVTIDSAHSWLLADMTESSSLRCNDSATPNEIYLGDQCAVSISGEGTSEGVWLRLTSGTSGTLALPNLLVDDNWAFGSATGADVGWNLTVTGARPGLGIESHAGSSWTVIGADAGVKDTTLGLYLDPPVAPANPVTLSGLSIGVVGSGSPLVLSFPWGDSPQLTLENVNLGPIAWQVYVGSVASNGPVPVDVTISDSVVNEVGVFAGSVNVTGSTLQLAVLGALTPAAAIQASDDDIWCQTLLASGGGAIVVESSNVHGSLLQASTGGQITIANSDVLWPGSDTPVCDSIASLEHMEANGGRPSCNPFTTPMQLSSVVVADSDSSIELAGPANAACLAIVAGSYTPGLVIEAAQNPPLASAQTGTVSCLEDDGGAAVEMGFGSYPVPLIQDADSGVLLVPGAGYDCSVTVGAASNEFGIAVPSCAQ